MTALDRWVVRRVLRFLGALPESIQQGPGTCFVNLSGVSLSDRTFVDFVTDELAESGVPPARVCFEITETSAVEHIDQAQEVMGTLRDLGCAFALDDFGQGMSSYGYLKNLPVSYLKIDGLFIQDIAKDSLDRAMVESINQLAQLYGLRTVAESVSSQAVLDVVRAIGIDLAQGHHVGSPKPLEKIAEDLLQPGRYQSKTNPA
jgi:two-component system CheB/CheR fusion protein